MDVSPCLSRAIASILAMSLIASAPGAQAWGQVATTVRSGSVGAGPTATAGTIAPASGSLEIPALALPAPSPSLSDPSLTPLPAGPAAAVASPASIVSRPATFASHVSALSARLAPALAGAQNPAAAAAGKNEGSFRWLSTVFDGLGAHRLAADAADAGGQNDAPRGSELGRPQPALVPVLVTLVDPGTKEALDAVIEKLSADLGFRLDASFDAVRAPGLVTVRGAIPVSRLLALKAALGVVDVAAAAGRVSDVAPVPHEAPASENLLRAGLRSLLLKNRMMLSLIATVPLQFAVALAFTGPVMGGIAFGGAAAALKLWMLGTAFGMAASFSFLAPVFALLIPLKPRVAATYAVAIGLAWSFYALAPGLPALWLAANLGLSALAAFRNLQTPPQASASPRVDKILNSTENAAFIDILGFQATIPILILGGMMPLAFGILAVSTALSLLLLIKARSKTAVPALSAHPPSTPSTPAEPESDKPAPKVPVHEPFVPATDVIAGMEKLLKTDPAAALEVAAVAIVNKKKNSPDVKIGAQRILDALPIEQTLPHYLDLLKLTARNDIQTWKEVHVDPWWYLQRTALKRLSREAAALKPGTPDLIDTLRTTYKDRNPSVRLAAADALKALGIDPGLEASDKPAPTHRRLHQKSKETNFMKWPAIIMLSAMGVLMLWMALGNHAPPSPPPSNPPAVTELVQGPGSAAPVLAPATDPPAADAPVAADTVKADPQAAALDSIAKDLKRTADATEEMAKPKGSFWSTLLWAVLPIVLLVWLMKKWGGGKSGLRGGGSAGPIDTAPDMNFEKPTTRFSDVAGIDDSLIELQEIVDFLRDPARFNQLGARMPKGVLMEGPPGTGKTLLAKALAGETEKSFISISGSDFVELYVGMGARRVRELFAAAREKAPAIIFIDEIDAVGKKRGDGGPGSHSNDEREQTLNQILKEMDGFDNSSGVLVVAATNRVETLDEALTRPGRFDRKIHVGLPEALGREAILALHAKTVRLSPAVDLRLIARRTTGLSGAFLENIINEAAMLAARRGADAIGPADIDEGVDRATIGGKRSLKLSEALKRRIAAHEAGHVLANLLNEKAELRVPVNKVTILPHGSGALGFAESGSEEGDQYLRTRGELEARLDTVLGGLVAENIFYGEWSTGPSSDLESATRVARTMVQQLGMSDEMGLAQTAPNQYGTSPFGADIDAKAHAEINKLLTASRERVDRRLRAGAAQHKAMIAALLEKETLSADEIEAIARPQPKP